MKMLKSFHELVTVAHIDVDINQCHVKKSTNDNLCLQCIGIISSLSPEISADRRNGRICHHVR